MFKNEACQVKRHDLFEGALLQANSFLMKASMFDV